MPSSRSPAAMARSKSCSKSSPGRAGLHAKPIGLLNVCGFYDGLVGFFDHAIAAGFIKARHRNLIVTAATSRELLDQLVTHEMPQVKKWIRPNEG